jgi:plastocyanin/cytochrome c2
MRTRFVAIAACVVAPVLITACSLTGETADVSKGKTLFVQRCGSCHTLSRAGTTGVAGPNLDEAFQNARRAGFGQSTFAGMVEHQIKYPPRRAEMDPQTKKPTTLMPADLVTGSAVTDVAQYVAQSAGKAGKDTGPLAAIGAKKAAGTAKEQNGTLSIPVAQAGLAYQFATATATAGKVTVESKNPQPTGHDIAIEGNGVNTKGAVVQSGGTSKFTATLKPGTYTFYCSVPGHREGGMVGKLTVK